MTTLAKPSLLAATILSTLAVAPALASAQAPALQPLPSPAIAAAAAAPEKSDSINLSPLGLVLGDVALTYEHLWNGTHGLVLEAEGAHSTNDDGSATSGGVGIGYRWHWSGKQDSGFLGVMASQSFGSGDATVQVNDGPIEKYDMRLYITSVTMNVGKRWMIGDNLNITARIGAGRGWYSVKVQNDGPHAKDAEDTMNALLSIIPVALDGELSAGYTF